MATPTGSHVEKTKKLVVIYAPPARGAIGHLVPLLELGELLAGHGLEVSIVLSGQPAEAEADGTAPADDAGSLFSKGVAAAQRPGLSVHRLPHVSRPSDVPAHDHVSLAFELARASNPGLRDFLRRAGTRPAALVLDFFCGSAVGVGAELGIPTYFFFTSSVAALAALLYLPVIHERTEPRSLRDLGGEPLHFPGIPPVPADHLPASYLDRDGLGNRLFLALSEQVCRSRGVIVNNFRSLEPRAAEAIAAGLCTPPGRRTPPLHCVGPLMMMMANNRSGEEAAGAARQRHECLAWLDAQPEASVVFLCFGSMGRLSAEQARHVARGLEMSGQRFLWVVRRPPAGDGEGDADADDLGALLPGGFAARTRGRGLVVGSWAPQREVLAHGAVGGFVTHCGWNSALEAVAGGVPMLAWPMYAEQRMNCVFLAEETRLAVPLRGYDGELVAAEEVAAKVRWLVESGGGRELRERARAAMRRARDAVSDGGESRTALLELVRQWKS